MRRQFCIKLWKIRNLMVVFSIIKRLVQQMQTTSNLDNRISQFQQKLLFSHITSISIKKYGQFYDLTFTHRKILDTFSNIYIIQQIMRKTNKKRVGKYLIFLNQQLGTGSYSVVYRGINETTSEEVAIKIMKKENIQEDQYTKQAFIRQIQIMKMLRSKNIIKFIDVHQTMNHYYVVQQLAGDGSFDKILKQNPNGRFEEQKAIPLMIQILNGLGQMVKNGIVHRDLKPANILLKNGIIKIADFGFAKQSDNGSFLRTILGTPLYMSPQLLKEENYTYKCDIWALGIIFYQMLIGHTPWHWKGSDKKSWQYIETTPLEFPSECKISPAMKQLINGCLQYQERQRYEWQQIYLSPIFAEKFKQNFEGDKQDSIKTAFIVADIRMAIHSQNIDMIKHMDHAVLGNKIDFDGFTRIFQTISDEMTSGKIKLLYKNCLIKSNVNQDTLTKAHLRQFLKNHNINLRALVATTQMVDMEELRLSAPIIPLLKRLYQNFEKKKIDLLSFYRTQDREKKNALSITQFIILIRKIDPQLTQHQGKILFKEFDLNLDGMISFNEFQRTICKIAGIPNKKG